MGSPHQNNSVGKYSVVPNLMCLQKVCAKFMTISLPVERLIERDRLSRLTLSCHHHILYSLILDCGLNCGDIAGQSLKFCVLLLYVSLQSTHQLLKRVY